MISRRDFLVAGALSVLGTSYVLAQSRPIRVGMLAPFTKDAPLPRNILAQLAELGYRESAGIVLEFRSAEGSEERYPKLARELIDAKCAVIFSLGAADAFYRARTSVPVVFVLPDEDPLDKGYVRSLSRPGGNMTGVYIPQPALAVKRLEVAQEMLPKASHFLVLSDTYSKDQLAALREAAEARRVRLTVIEYKHRPRDPDFQGAFETGRRAKVDALIGVNSPNVTTNRAKLVALIAKHRLPAFVANTAWVDEPGILMGYQANIDQFARRAAEMGVRIIRGANPAEIPVEQPHQYDLIVNFKTAQSLGVKIPKSVRARATRIVQ